MLIFDQLKKNDPRLRLLGVLMLCGLIMLLAGLWWVQIVSARDYQANLETQAFRTVRIPAVRGKILDRNGVILAENRPTYNVSLYLDELRKDFDVASSQQLARARAELKLKMDAEALKLNRRLTRQEKKQFVLGPKEKALLRQCARCAVASNVVARVSQNLRLPLSLNLTNFERHYEQSLALPLPVVTNLTSAQIALFEEQCTSPMGVDLEVQSTRFYPYSNTAAHVIGSVHRDDSSSEGEDAFFSFRLPDYRGQVGIEAGYDKELRGKAGVKSVVVNNVGYRQTENVWAAAEPGMNVVLTIDLSVQRKTERALQVFGPATRGAVVVMDVDSGDIMAMASSPTLDPNIYIRGITREEWRHITELRAEQNRATHENYAPGSIFKTVVGLACLEAGLDPNQRFYNPGVIYVGRRPIIDPSAHDDYDFRKALMHSSNTYFITNGLKAGIENIVRLGQRLHLGERTGLQLHQEVPGTFPSLQKISSHWYEGDSANICIGQGKMDVTPLQMAVMTAAVANGGKVLWPRLVDRIEPADPASGAAKRVLPGSQIRDDLGVKARSLEIVREAMFADVQSPGGTGTKAALPGLSICGKTGTAQKMDAHNKVIGETTWFVSFAPYEHARYAVVVMVENEAYSGSGDGTCAPVAAKIYNALLERGLLARANTGKLAKAE